MMLKKSMNELIEIINNNLDGIIKSSPLNTKLEESMQYSLDAGGKRIRPVLVLLTLEVLNENYKKGLQTALALEMIHTYSLIHDDLPAMDNDDFRRGKLTNHKVYGEWKAILAGDALLTKAFELIANDKNLEAETKVKVISRLAHDSGNLGMVGFSEHLGLMFQIKDDLLDVYGDEKKLGKKVGSDVENHKSTYVSLLGKSGAEEKLKYHKDAAIDAVNQLKSQYDVEPLLEIVDLFYSRDH